MLCGEPEVGERARQRPATGCILCHGAGFVQVAQNLSDEERVAVRLATDLVGKPNALLGQLIADRGLHQRPDVVSSEARQANSLDPLLAPQIAEQLPEGMASSEFGVTMGPEHE